MTTPTRKPWFTPWVFSLLVTLILIAKLVLDYQDPGKNPISSAVQKYQQSREQKIESLLVELAQRINQDTPRMVDEHTRLDTTIAGPGHNFTVKYTLVDVPIEDVDVAELIKYMRPRLVEGYRHNGPFQQIEAVARYVYEDMNGKPMMEIVISPEDLRAETP